MSSYHSDDNLRTLLEDLLNESGGADSAGSIPFDIPGFEIGEYLGEGGTSLVFKARQSSTGQMVAIKFLRADLIHRRIAQRMKRECAALVRLDSRAFPRIIDSGELRGIGFIVQEFVEGQPLRAFVEEGNCDAGERLGLLVRIARCVGLAHQQGIIHRDLKPANILIRADGSPVVVDFGIAGGVEGGGTPGFTAAITVEGSVMGTPAYMAPEQARGLGETSTATDVFSLGLIALQLLTGDPPVHHGIDWTAEGAGKKAVDIPRLGEFSRGAILRAILRKALQVDPADRYRDANEFADDLARYEGGRKTVVDGEVRRMKRRRWLVAASLVIVVGLGGWFGVWKLWGTETNLLTDQVKESVITDNPQVDLFGGVESGDNSGKFSEGGLLDDATPLVGNRGGDGERWSPPDGRSLAMRSENDEMKRIKKIVKMAAAAGIIIGSASMSSAQCLLDQFSFDEETYGFRWNAIWGLSHQISGDLAIVGARFADPKGIDSGAAYIYHFDGVQWVMDQQLVPADGDEGDGFGYSVNIKGDEAIVGAVWDEVMGAYSGSAYVFRFDGTNWVEEAKLVDPTGATWDQLGAVAIEGDTAVVGSVGADDFTSEGGAVLIFHFDGTNWQLQQKIGDPNSWYQDNFGGRVAIEGNRIVTISYNRAEGGGGAIHVFEFDGTQWNYAAKLVPSDNKPGDGATVFDLDGDRIIIGAWGADGESGAAYIFEFNGTQWNEIAKLLPSQRNAGDRFGWSVSVSGDTATIGSPHSDMAGADAGAAFVFRHSGTKWIESSTLIPQSIAPSDNFGVYATIDARTAICGTLLNDPDGTSKASAYFFDLDCRSSQLKINPQPLVSGQQGTFTVTDALPNERTWLLYSLNGLGETFIRYLNVVVDLDNPQLGLGPNRTDANGDVEWSAKMPAVRNNLPVWFQAVQRQNVTNYVATEIVP